MITIVLQSSLCWLVFLLIYQLFLHKETFFRFNRFYLLGTLTLGMSIPFGRIFWEYLYPAVAQFEGSLPIQGSAKFFELPVLATTQKAFDWLSWCYTLYWAGVVLFLLLLIKQIISLLYMIQKYPKQKHNDFTLVTTDYEHLPFSFMGYVFVSSSIEFKDDEMTRILRHEGSHVKGIHSVDVLWLELIKSFAWFSPMVYWYKRNMRNTHEFLADAVVLKYCDTGSYGQLLINNSQKSLQMALANHFIYSQLKDRIHMMMKLPSKPRNVWKYTLIIPIVLFLGILFAYKSDHAGSTLEPSKKWYTWNGKHLRQGDKIKILKTQQNADGTWEVTNFLINREGSALLDSLPTSVRYLINGEKASRSDVENLIPVQIVAIDIIKEEHILKLYGEATSEGIISIKTKVLYFIDGNEVDKDEVNRLNPQDIASKSTVKLINNQDGLVRIVLKKRPASILSEDKMLQVGTAFTGAVLEQVEQMPLFPGCEEIKDFKLKSKCATDKLNEFIFTHVKYPIRAKEIGIEGKALVSFVVNKDGSMTDVEVVSDPGGGIGDEALQVIHKMQAEKIRWIPAMNFGEKVPVKYVLPILFKLNEAKVPTSDDLLYILNDKKATADEVKNIFPQHIESIEVFKSDQAIKLYGDEGKHGVIKVNTKTHYIVDDKETTKDKVDQLDPDEIATMDIVKYGTENGIVKIRLKSKVPPPPPPLMVPSAIDGLEALSNVEPYKLVEVMPTFPGGESGLLKYLSQNIKYPNLAKEAGIQGRVILQFVVETNGTISRTKLIRGIGGGCDEESIRVINSINYTRLRWSPGMHDGVAVPVLITFPIFFKLDGSLIPSKESDLNAIGVHNLASEQHQLSIVPNPASTQIELKWAIKGKVNFEIFDLKGQVVLKQVIQNFDGIHLIDVNKLVKGSYIVRVQQGEISDEQKLILH